MTPRTRGKKSNKERTLRTLLRKKLYQLDADLLASRFHDDHGTLQNTPFNKAVSPMIQEVIGEDYSDDHVPALCYRLCKDIVKKRRNYLRNKQHVEGKFRSV